MVLRRALARVAGRMVESRGWERLGFARLADYAVERAGVSARELRHLAAVDAGFNSVDAYAEERLGLARSRARALLRVERAARECPALRATFAAGRLSWVRAEVLLPLLAEAGASAWREAWVEHAGRVSVRRLRDDVEQALALGCFEPPELDEGGALPAGVQTGAIAGSQAETARLFFATSSGSARLFRALLAATQRGLERVRGRPLLRYRSGDVLMV